MSHVPTMIAESPGPSSQQIDDFALEVDNLRRDFLLGQLQFDEVLAGIRVLRGMKMGYINCIGQPEIPKWADQGKPIVMHIPGCMVDPATVETADVFKDGEESLRGEEFVRRGQATECSANACALDFYARPENWKYLAHIPPEVTELVFTETIFLRAGSYHVVGYLSRVGARWDRHCSWFDDKFDRGCRVVRFAKPKAQ